MDEIIYFLQQNDQTTLVTHISKIYSEIIAVMMQKIADIESAHNYW